MNTFAGMFLARLSASLITLLTIPVYLHLVGLEALAAINLFLSLQAIIVVADFGFSALATRLVAQSAQKDEKTETNGFVLEMYAYQTKGMLFIAISTTVIAYFFLEQWHLDWRSWFGIDGRFIAALFGGLQLALMLRWNFCIAVLTAFSKYQVVIVALILSSIVRTVMCATSLWIFPSLEIYFLIQFLITVGLTAWVSKRCRELITSVSSIVPIRSVYQVYGTFMWNNSAIAGIAALAVNLDKFMLVRLVSAADFSIYTMSATLAASVSVVVSAFFSTYSARYAAILVQSKDQQTRASVVLESAQLMNAIVLCVATPLIFWAYPVAILWVGEVSLANQIANIIPVLALGFVINGILNVPYMLQLSSGDAKTPLTIIGISILFMVPAVYFSARLGGVHVVAWCWFGLNFFFLCFWPALVFKRLLSTSAWVWFFKTVLFPMIVIFCSGYFLRLLMHDFDAYTHRVLQLFIFFIFMCSIAAISIPSLRRATLHQAAILYR